MTTAKPPHEQTGPIFDWELIKPHMSLIYQCADRACSIVITLLRERGSDKQILLDAEKQCVLMDIAVAKMSRDIDLLAWMLSDDLAFFADFQAIQKTIDRACGKIPSDVFLRFAGNGSNTIARLQ